mgnify:CR=1 FL=1
MKPSMILLAILALFTLFWRILPHEWNMTPLFALALFAGARLPTAAQRLGLPLLVMVLSDLWLGGHPTLLFVYLGVVAAVWLGSRMQQAGLLHHAGFALAASTLFFVISNFGVWLVAGLYPPTLEGLLACYTLAIPFFFKAAAGDLFFVMVFYALFHGLAVWQAGQQRHLQMQ